MENLYGMFRTRANIHRKACQHKTIKAVERMYMLTILSCIIIEHNIMHAI